MNKVFNLSWLLILFSMLNGCTALGLLADSQLDKKHDSTTNPASSLATQPNPGVFTELGLMLDGAVFDGVKKVLQGKPEQPREVCRKRGNLTECWLEENID